MMKKQALPLRERITTCEETGVTDGAQYRSLSTPLCWGMEMQKGKLRVKANPCSSAPIRGRFLGCVRFAARLACPMDGGAGGLREDECLDRRHGAEQAARVGG